MEQRRSKDWPKKKSPSGIYEPISVVGVATAVKETGTGG